MSRSAAKDSFAPAGAHARRYWDHGLACGFAQPWLWSAAAPRLEPIRCLADGQIALIGFHRQTRQHGAFDRKSRGGERR
jgi:hypothetical protein